MCFVSKTWKLYSTDRICKI